MNVFPETVRAHPPLFTVVTVVFNGVGEVEKTIKSVIDQGFCNYEYVVIDGGSDDGTVEILKKYSKQISYWVSESDLGIYDAMNKALLAARGEWIIFLNAGDCFSDDGVLEYLACELRGETVDIVYGDHSVFYPSTGKLKNKTAGFILDIWKGSVFSHQSVFVRLSYHQRNPFNISNKISADFEFFYKAFNDGVTFKKINKIVSVVSAGGLSDIRRVDSVLGWWCVVEKTWIVNCYYVYRILLEMVKGTLRSFFDR